MTKKDYEIIGGALKKYIYGNDEVVGEDIRSRRWEVTLDMLGYLIPALEKDGPKFNGNKFKDFILGEE